ncbi:peptidoglycan D,D-transpeptidase FtsI family protein [Paenibacillus harenae]|uniref:peptidoglycan D,D-transpeptidase FtsI family protein n=1 Tax=Paenibacillus harenae TaxID=306543 RepID=UPI00278F3A3E|nr:penicillin-binding protein 2 [Paenibacillus harenae]MDQ0061347.1 cell division protein FtsI/penicillin-binding protein 2 [Paenibacillus harenae]
MAGRLARRVWAASLVVVCIMIVFIVRLAWLQLLPWSSHAAVHTSAAANRGGWQRLSVIQRQRNLVLDSGRGDFLDRYGQAITGETYSAAAFFPVRPDVRGDKDAIAKLAALLNVSREQLNQYWDEVREPVFWLNRGGKLPMRLNKEQADEIERLGLNGVSVLPYRNRYVSGFEAKHAIGFTSQHPEWLAANHPKEVASGKRRLSEQVGGSGLEKSLDKLLHGIGATSVSYFIDGRNAPVHGLDLRITQPGNHYYPLKVQTTIDLKLQNELEAYADKQGLKEGAIVVLDANNADVVAMVSRPKLKPGQFESSDGSEWTNHALTAVAPGSIFKLVTAAAALEAGVVNKKEKFHCNGEYGKYGLSCWKDGGHGTLTLQEGLAQSCNIVFATIAERMRAAELQHTAASLGIGRKAGWHRDKPFGPFHKPLRLLEEEEPGQLFASSGEGATGIASQQALAAVDGGVMAQSGIGQRDVSMSPLQAANLIVTLLNEGRLMEPRLVSEIRYADGQRMVKLPVQRARGIRARIHAGTAHALLRGMRAVVDHGTGRSIRLGVWTVAGKSGTAQTERAGIALNHQWFAGYGPVKSPRYAVSVLAANRTPGSPHQATKLFRGVMDIAARNESTHAARR